MLKQFSDSNPSKKTGPLTEMIDIIFKMTDKFVKVTDIIFKLIDKHAKVIDIIVKLLDKARLFPKFIHSTSETPFLPGSK